MTTMPPHGSESQGERLPVYIFAGGKSTRFGKDKALIRVDGVSMIVRVADTLKPVADSITIVASQDGVYDHLGLKTIADVVTAKGPIGALLTAMRHGSRKGWILVSSCDWVGLRTEWIALLMAESREGSDAVVFRARHFEPLLGLYHTSIQEIVSSRIESGNLAMHELLGMISTVPVAVPDGWDKVRNVNRPSDIPNSSS